MSLITKLKIKASLLNTPQHSNLGFILILFSTMLFACSTESQRTGYNNKSGYTANSDINNKNSKDALSEEDANEKIASEDSVGVKPGVSGSSVKIPVNDLEKFPDLMPAIGEKLDPYTFDNKAYLGLKYCIAYFDSPAKGLKDLFGRALPDIATGDKFLISKNKATEGEALLIYTSTKGATNFYAQKSMLTIEGCTDKITALKSHVFKTTTLYSDETVMNSKCTKTAGTSYSVTAFGYKWVTGVTKNIISYALKEDSCGAGDHYTEIAQETSWMLPILGVRQKR